MEFRILGPVSVAVGDREVTLGGVKQRSLLALLLLHRNEPVSTDRLVDELWGERPPETAQKTVQVYVSQLRKLLGEGRIETHGHGYVLRVGEGELDLDRFQALVEGAQQEEPRGAAASLREALSLFRGEPLQDLAYEPWAQSEIARLREIRLAALEQRLQADLELGRHRALVAELEALVRELPLREELRGLLMLALYRSGRQADALEVHREGRRLLDEQLGLEPGPELRELEQQILQHDPSLAAPVAPLVERARRRRGLLLVVGGAVLLLAAAVSAAVVELTGRSSSIGVARPNSIAVIDPKTGHITAQIPVGRGPVAVAVGDGAVWVANAGDQTVSRIDPRRKRVIATVGTGQTSSAIAVGGGAVWIANAVGGKGTVSRIEPESNSVVGTIVTRQGSPDVFAPLTPSAIAVDAVRVWANSNPRALLARFSSLLGRAQRPVFLGRAHSIDGIAIGEGAVWVSSSADDTVLRLDATTGHVTATIRIAATGQRVVGPYGIAVGDGSIWVADSIANAVSRIDPRLRTVAATIPVGLRPTNVAVGEGGVWVLNRDDGTVSRIDPQTNAVTSVVHIGERVTGIAAGGGAVWVTVAGGPAAARRVVPPQVARALPASSCSPLVYDGPGQPQYLIASDLPRLLEKPSRVTAQMSQAIQLVLEQHRFRAGAYTIGYQSCDDSSAAEKFTDPVRCVANAEAYARAPSLLAVVGTYNSFCAGIELPITNASPSGPLATISPSNSYVGLTSSGPATTPLEPDQYYPTGVRSYARLIGTDRAQGAADALLGRQLGLRRIYLLDDGTGTAVADAIYTARSARRLGLKVVGRSTWNVRAKGFRGLARRVAQTQPDGMYVAGCVCAHGIELLRDLKGVLPPGTTFFAPDNFQATGVFLGSKATAGIYVSVAGRPVQRLGLAGRRFAAAFRARYGEPVAGSDVVAAAQAAEITLAAISRSGGTRASVVAEMLATRVVDGQLGTFAFDPNGDPTRTAFAIYRFPLGKPHHGPPYVSIEDDGGVVDRVIEAPADLARP